MRNLVSRLFCRHIYFGSSKPQLIKSPLTVSIIGAPLGHGQPLQGVDDGPGLLRGRGLCKKLEQDGWIVEDTGDLQFEMPLDDTTPKEDTTVFDFPSVRWARAVGEANRKIARATYVNARDGKFVLTLGGDHSLAIGSISGILRARPNIGLVWVDAHADLNSPDTSSSGNIHGMVLSYLMNYNRTRSTPGFEWMNAIPVLKPSRLVYVGLRDVDRPEKQMIKELGIKAFTIFDVDRYGIGQVMIRAIEHITSRQSNPIHLSFDIDSIDPTFAPSTGTRVSGGLTYREGYYIAESLAQTGLLTSMDMVEVNPKLGPDPEADAEVTADLANGLIASALGNTII
eukprot:TRINITY_DN41574_c0_g1_i2.p1 TRINITY_DN41574_c0_g1~~TRINITY_DN41574_c0_g1_i2.p1  ORF type:complete len:341 (+),score=22.47 TRINITY_DN41574_c0_g1_i2:74-1096(+)